MMSTSMDYNNRTLVANDGDLHDDGDRDRQEGWRDDKGTDGDHHQAQGRRIPWLRCSDRCHCLHCGHDGRGGPPTGEVNDPTSARHRPGSVADPVQGP